MSLRILSFKEAIREAQEQALEDYTDCFLIGEGVGDPKQIFGTTTGLKDKFPRRVFDMPISENALTGVCVGAAVNGMKPILVHQRMDFSLYAMDQLVNNAAKWHSMYGGQASVPFIIRMIIGRGWGQGNQHSQNLTAMYAHVPGLKIVVPTTAYDAKGLFRGALDDPNPVLFIEHRWLYETTSKVPEHHYKIALGDEQTLLCNGDDVTVVAIGHSVLEARRAVSMLPDVSVDLIALSTIKPMCLYNVHQSVKRTGRLIVLDDAWKFCGLAAEIVASVVEENINLKSKPIRLTYPDYPSGSSPTLTKGYYVGPYDIASAIEKSIGRELELEKLFMEQMERTHDVPDSSFKGPF